jgi:hypothetical protein
MAINLQKRKKIANYFIINWSYIYVVFNFIFNLAVDDFFISNINIIIFSNNYIY